MSEWIRHRGSKSMPKCLEGKRFEVRYRNGEIVDQDEPLRKDFHAFSWENAGHNRDIMAYRITGDINPPDYSKGFPVGTTAKDIGAKVGDEFVVVGNRVYHGFEIGDRVRLVSTEGKESGNKFEKDGDCWAVPFDNLAPTTPKTAIELQAEEVGIPEPVRLVDSDGWIEWKGGECPVELGTLIDAKFRNGEVTYHAKACFGRDDGGSNENYCAMAWGHDGSGVDITSYRLHRPQEWPEDRMDVIGQNGNDGLHYDETHLGIKRPDGDGWVKYNAGDAVNLDGVVSIDWRAADGQKGEAMSWPREFCWLDGKTNQIAWYRLNYGDKIDTSPQRVENETEIVHMPTNKYQRTIKGVTVDVYDVLAAFGVTCQARGHAIKKLLMAGQRGHKDEAQDLREAVQAIERSIELVGK